MPHGKQSSLIELLAVKPKKLALNKIISKLNYEAGQDRRRVERAARDSAADPTNPTRPAAGHERRRSRALGSSGLAPVASAGPPSLTPYTLSSNYTPNNLTLNFKLFCHFLHFHCLVHH